MADDSEEIDAVPDSEKIIVILDKACLEVGKTKDGVYKLLDCDQTALLRKNHLNPSEYRPDITHMCLLTLLDSPLNKTGHLKVYVRTSKNVLIEFNPKIRLPRTFKRFSGLIVELLHKHKIRAVETKEVLLKVIRNPVEQYLPPGCRIIGLSATASKKTEINEYISTIPKDTPVAFIVGAFAHGQIDLSQCTEELCISDHHLSAAVVCGKICCAAEQKLEIF
ncbi:putative Multicopy suppressor of ras1 [Monocercomonoides exilis]|uniref:putative Multicopy suppressor of ras1 n=1 Tax=Monocercomonoides exilis TaxID=2049356 RepID=UPI003559B4BB|nr:putative Multicopy suppressor of ras1 [Monocercomonoides exilis]|eukprot:MONOS_16785.1-p1 / transcript=MONOS_16785.1 / gene=MONOS_16785 / organism=Monocercomonoides_exilis_PA203 / gene_product= Multicopy suppressor of ras1 / transcript_product= Multicopy suppressor of ras1 / location=Mono_scaffold00758:29582-30424(-) / protein_length=222 / sequence_SO=supercontig / SO=protein_coding / is_pseudo=false